MQVGLIRHGETSWNAVKRIQGQTDIPLNENGIKQAKLLAQRLQGEREDQHWDYIITSDLQRALATGQHIAEALHVPMLEPDTRLRERYFGQIEGTTLEERVERWGDHWKELDLGAETDEAMRSRGLQLLEELYALYPGRNILCVTHGSFIAELLLELFPAIEDMRINNLSYSILKRDGDSWELQLHNCTKHLESDQCV